MAQGKRRWTVGGEDTFGLLEVATQGFVSTTYPSLVFKQGFDWRRPPSIDVVLPLSGNVRVPDVLRLTVRS